MDFLLLTLNKLHGFFVCRFPLQHDFGRTHAPFVGIHSLCIHLVVAQGDSFKLDILLIALDLACKLWEFITDAEEQTGTDVNDPTVAACDQFEATLISVIPVFFLFQDSVEAIAASGWELFEEELVQ